MREEEQEEDNQGRSIEEGSEGGGRDAKGERGIRKSESARDGGGKG